VSSAGKTPLDLAMKWMEIFFRNENFGELESILTPDCTFSGPFARYESAKTYINTLKDDPPGDCNFEILETVESQNDVALFYRFKKSGVNAVIAQYFKIDDGLISEIRLVFDSADF